MSLEKKVYGDYGRDTVKEVDFLMPNSKFMERVCLKYFPAKASKVVYPPILASEVKPLKISTDIKSIFMVGNSLNKGSRIFCALTEQFSDITFGIVGDASIEPGGVRVEGNVRRMVGQIS